MDTVETSSWIITKASLDKSTGEMRFAMVASDTGKDSYDEQMSLELYQDFIKRATNGDRPPEVYCSEAWSGGMPYLSVAHYDELSGKGIAGKITSLYIDGNRLKAKGVFSDTPLGRACFKSVQEDLKDKDKPDNIRVSIGFLDWAHAHGQVRFERKSLDDRCPMCAEGLGDKVYLKGHLLHNALTRVPANRRTDVELEVGKSMAIKTREEDAASIIGEELAGELEKESAMVGKSEALVERADEEAVVEDAKTEGTQEQSDTSEEAVEPEVVELAVAGEVEKSFEERILAELMELRMKMADKEKEEDEEDDESCGKKKHKSHILDSALGDFIGEFDKVYAREGAEERLAELQPAMNQLGDVIRSMFAPKIVEEPQVEQKSEISIAEMVAESIRKEIAPLRDEIVLVKSRLDAQSGAQTVLNSTPQRRNIQPSQLLVAKADTSAEKPNSYDALARRSVGLQ